MVCHVTALEARSRQSNRSEERLTLETSALNSVQWPVYVISSVNNTKLPSFLCYYKLTQRPSTPPWVWLLLLAKYFIYKVTWMNSLYSLFKVQLRGDIITERYIATKNKTANLIDDKWNRMPYIKYFVQKFCAH